MPSGIVRNDIFGYCVYLPIVIPYLHLVYIYPQWMSIKNTIYILVRFLTHYSEKKVIYDVEFKCICSFIKHFFFVSRIWQWK
jgi:hypothetical protein